MTIGVLGAGQLGRMLALAGYPLGLDFLFLDPVTPASAARVAPQIEGPFDDVKVLQQLARESEVLTFDWENVPVEPLRELAQSGVEVPVCPPLPALETAQDRVLEKRLFEKLDIPTTRWAAVDSWLDLMRAAESIGLPGVLKTRRMGYDGKGQAVVKTSEDLERAWSTLSGAPLLYEELVAYDCEVSIIGARSRSGEIAIYPLNGNIHAQGILRLTRAPFGPQRWWRLAGQYLERVLTHFHYSGVLTIELFVRGGRLIANEMAPRVHNSGHWTIEGAVTSQFENHLRAILDLPLGECRAVGHCAMINLIGELPPLASILAHPGAHLHAYDKQPRPGRKVGHCTLVARTARERDARAQRLLREVAPGVGIP
jgi:5-(carboxyamino)imidazole ribonucleotide synthase